MVLEIDALSRCYSDASRIQLRVDICPGQFRCISWHVASIGTAQIPIEGLRLRAAHGIPPNQVIHDEVIKTIRFCILRTPGAVILRILYTWKEKRVWCGGVVSMERRMPGP